LRERQIKNLFTSLLVSLGTPMLLGGDEFRRTQRGNNNAYCQDNEISWYDWNLFHKEPGLHRFVKYMIAFRLRHPAFLRPEFYSGKDGNYNAIPDITWFDEKGASPDWAKADKKLALMLDGSRADTYADRDDNDFFIMFNASNLPVTFSVVGAPEEKRWFRAVDTSLPSPDDIVETGVEGVVSKQGEYLVRELSVVVLISKAV
jgi:isoamylase